MHVHIRQKSIIIKLVMKSFLQDVVLLLWHDIVYIELLHCVTNFKLVWN